MHKLLGGGVEWGKQEIGAIWQPAAVEAECHRSGWAPAVPRCDWKLQVAVGLGIAQEEVVIPSLLFFLSPLWDVPLAVLFWAYTIEIGPSSVKPPPTNVSQEVHRLSVSAAHLATFLLNPAVLQGVVLPVLIAGALLTTVLPLKMEFWAGRNLNIVLNQNTP